jgi:hypothetical protein
MANDPAPRGDSPGTWHHVLDRGLARRPIFETREDVRRLLALLACQARRGTIEVHSYSILTTHFHALVRSLTGELSHVMMEVESSFVRWFNRRRGRDGPLFATRFRSRIVDTSEYWFAVVRYIDRNAVDAGLADRPRDRPYGSAWHYAHAKGPPWLTRGVLQERAAAWSGSSSYDAAAYESTFARPLTPAQRWRVERQPDRPVSVGAERAAAFDPLAVAPAHVRRELLARVRLADGEVLSAPLVDPDTLDALWEARRLARPRWERRQGRGRPLDRWSVLRVGLLARACGLDRKETSRRVRLAPSRVTRCLEQHRELLEQDESYRATAAAIVEDCVRAVFEEQTN